MNRRSRAVSAMHRTCVTCSRFVQRPECRRQCLMQEPQANDCNLRLKITANRPDHRAGPGGQNVIERGDAVISCLGRAAPAARYGQGAMR